MPRRRERIDRIDQVVIRMYRMGTGDCFTLKFMKGDEVSFKMMIDCGCWTGAKNVLKPFIQELKKDLDDHVDLLVVTHEHKDHVWGFQQCEDLFTDGDFQVEKTWMAWTEKDGDDAVEEWKQEYGEKKRSLAAVAMKLSAAINTPEFANQLAGAREEASLRERRQSFAAVLQGFAELQASGFDATKPYVDGLAGMDIVKNTIAKDRIVHPERGDVVQGLPGLEGVRIFILGPPALFDDVKVEEGPTGEAYEHNDELEDTDAFAAALNAFDGPDSAKLLPFDDWYVTSSSSSQTAYNNPAEAWRKIDFDWLQSAGSLALRMSSRTNNLSLVLAIEFIDSGKILLFPGDAEFGSWKSWHQIDWKKKVPDLTTEKLLNRVVFYKVAHHLSHHGTARSIGLEMMTSPDLVAMATLDYNVIPPGWKSTMPNAGIIKDLLERTKGRTMIMNTDGLVFDRKQNKPLEAKIKQFRKRMSDDERSEFKQNFEETELYISYSIKV
jgi:beta-lactamase superfamily II metal-dependent hydrolase